MKTKLIIAALLVAGLFSCEKQKLENLEIQVGTEFSDCAIPSDLMILSNESVDYNMFSDCSDYKYNVEEGISAEDWDEILQLFNWDNFKKIKTNAEDATVDGKYNFIEVRYGSRSHRVFFSGTDDVEIASIRLFAEKVTAMKIVPYAIGFTSFIFNQ